MQFADPNDRFSFENWMNDMATSEPQSARGWQARAVADGQPWKDRIGWSRVLAGLRKSFLRLPSPRSDFWW